MRQLVCGIFCVVMIANLQYGWTLFVHPIDQKFHWGTTAILCLCGGYEFDCRGTRTFHSQANAAANYDCMIWRPRVRSWLAELGSERADADFCLRLCACAHVARLTDPACYRGMVLARPAYAANASAASGAPANTRAKLKQQC